MRPSSSNHAKGGTEDRENHEDLDVCGSFGLFRSIDLHGQGHIREMVTLQSFAVLNGKDANGRLGQ